MQTLRPRIQSLKPALSQPGQSKPWQKNALSAKRKTGRAGVADRECIKRRDKYTCQECGTITEKLEVDHIVPLHNVGDDSYSNKRSLCIPCHERKTRGEIATAAGHRGASSAFSR
jgi:5-methylcytosine-specific restriction protein A